MQVEELLLALERAPDLLVERVLELLGAGPHEGSLVAGVARVGITPKRFASLRRFEQAVALARTSPSLTETALAAGYYDQSHFIRDFRRFSGAAPGELLGRPAESALRR
jgi:AraC-like DNA-binding protein